jgi:hypothetical protein
MEFKIDECHFESDNDYLDITVNSLEGYITISTTTTGEFSFDSELEIDTLCQTLKDLLKTAKGVNKEEIDRRIPGVGC